MSMKPDANPLETEDRPFRGVVVGLVTVSPLWMLLALAAI